MNMSDNNKPPPPPNVVNVPVGGGFENPAPGNDDSTTARLAGGPCMWVLATRPDLMGTGMASGVNSTRHTLVLVQVRREAKS